MASEYKTLRDEILQLYREQAQLAFASSLPLLGSLLIKGPSEVGNKWLLLSSALLLLGGISWKIRANYYKIFCIGSYLAVVHERAGKAPEDFSPGPMKAGWHTRWRKIDNEPVRYPELKGQLGRASARADATFVGSVAAALIVFTVGSDIAKLVAFMISQKTTPDEAGLIHFLKTVSAPEYFAAALSLLALGILVFNLRQLWHIQLHVSKYREELEFMIRDKRC